MPKFYVFDPGQTPAFSPTFDSLQEAAEHAQGIQWKHSSLQVQVLAVVAVIRPNFDANSIRVESEFTQLQLEEKKED